MESMSPGDLELAFLYGIARSILTVDGHYGEQERAALHRLCPPEAMRDAGFLASDGGVTGRFQVAATEALDQLPLLPYERKAMLLGSFLEACLADGALDEREAELLRNAAKLLHLDDEDLDRFLDGHPDVGLVELEDP